MVSEAHYNRDILVLSEAIRWILRVAIWRSRGCISQEDGTRRSSESSHVWAL